MAIRRGQDYLVHRSPPLLQVLAQSGHANDESGIEPARPNGVHLREGQHGNWNQFSVRLLLTEPAKGFRDDAMPADTLHKSNPKGAGQSPGHLPRAPSGLLNFQVEKHGYEVISLRPASEGYLPAVKSLIEQVDDDLAKAKSDARGVAIEAAVESCEVSGQVGGTRADRELSGALTERRKSFYGSSTDGRVGRFRLWLID